MSGNMQKAVFPPLMIADARKIEALAQSVDEAHAGIVSQAGFESKELFPTDGRADRKQRITPIIEAVFCSHFGVSPADRYADFFEQISDLAERIAKRHVYADGNKRTTVTFALSCLNRQGIFYGFEDTPNPEDNQLYQWVQDLVTGKRNKTELVAFLRDNCL